MSPLLECRRTTGCYVRARHTIRELEVNDDTENFP
jgi:hypothetical protein